MRKIQLFNIAGFLIYAIMLIMFKKLGYTIAGIMAQPAQYLLLIIPFGIIFYIFHTVLTIAYKPKNKIEYIYKWMTLMNIQIISICNLTAPYIYIEASTGLQTAIIIYFILINVVLGTFFTINHFKNIKNHEQKVA